MSVVYWFVALVLDLVLIFLIVGAPFFLLWWLLGLVKNDVVDLLGGDDV